jgi:hypothetical protein
MTTSEESTTLYSSPQMRLDWPFMKMSSRFAARDPSLTTTASLSLPRTIVAAACISTYLSTPSSACATMDA